MIGLVRLMIIQLMMEEVIHSLKMEVISLNILLKCTMVQDDFLVPCSKGCLLTASIMTLMVIWAQSLCEM